MKWSKFSVGLFALAPLAALLAPAAPARLPQGLSSEPILFPVATSEPRMRQINVRELGARGDGVTDDSAAVQRAIDAAETDMTIHFPTGIYPVANLRVVNRNGLIFSGDGRRSVIKQKAGAQRIATFDGSSDIVITQLGFDANGIRAYGGVVFYAAQRIRLDHNWFWDSAPKRVEGTDRYAFVFAKGKVPSQDVQIVNNQIDDLQLEVNHSRRVVISGNEVNRAVKTAGIGIFTVGNDAVAEQYQIINNRVVDPLGAGISVGIDPPTDRNCRFARIVIGNNQVIRSRTTGYGIRIGTPDSSKPSGGNLFEDLKIVNNQMRVETTAPAPAQIIFANSSAAAGIIFKKMAITGNTLESQAKAGRVFAIDLKRVQDSLVAENVIKGFANGVALGGLLQGNELRDNVVQASGIAYAVEDSLGNNRSANNRVIGQPRQRWKTSALQPSDVMQNGAE
jgi:hypothetical protein